MGPLFEIRFEFVVENVLADRIQIRHWYAVPRIDEYVDLGDIEGYWRGTVTQVVWFDQRWVTVRCER